MQKNNRIFILMGFAFILIMTSCSGNKSTATTPEGVVESYLNALVAKDGNTMAALSCKDWEPSALMELDSFSAVKVRLEGLACVQSGTTGSDILVTCQGKIIATYNGEDQNMDLSLRSYIVVNQNGENLVCGYK